jgi:hypothetical protein
MVETRQDAREMMRKQQMRTLLLLLIVGSTMSLTSKVGTFLQESVESNLVAADCEIRRDARR